MSPRGKCGFIERTRPLALGYVHAGLRATADEVDTLRDRVIQYARKEGYKAGTVYVEHATGAEYGALMAAVWRQDAEVIIVPSMRHFTRPAVMKWELEQLTGARVLIAAPDQTSGFDQLTHRNHPI